MKVLSQIAELCHTFKGHTAAIIYSVQIQFQEY